MRLIRQQDDMNVVPHKALTVVTRHNFDTPKDDIQVYNTHYDTFAGAPSILYSMQMLDGVMPRAEVYVPNVTYIGAYFYRSSNVEEAEIWCPKCQKACNTPLDCVFYISEVKRAKVHFGDALLSSGLQFAFSGSTSTYSPKLERLELTGCRNAVNLSYMLHHTRRIYHLRFDELPNAGSMTFFALDTIFDKPTVLHIRDLLVAGGNTGLLHLGIADRYKDDIEVQQAIADIRALGRTVTVRYNTVPADLEDKVYRQPIITA